MKLLCIIDSLASGGAQRQLVNIAGALRQRGHSVSIATYYPEDFFRAQAEAAGVECIEIKKAGRWSLSPVLALRRILRDVHFDSLLAFQETPSIYAEIAHMGIRKTRLVVSERTFSYRRNVLGKEFIRAAMHLSADCVTSNSHVQTAWLRKHYPWLRSRLLTVWNGLSPEWFEPAIRPVRHSGPIRLLVVGRIVHLKNIIGLAKAVALCRDTYDVRAHVTVLGSADLDGGFSMREIESYIKSHGLESQWDFLGVRTNVRSLMQIHDALVLPSFYEGLPNVVCEALACGMPVLASNVCDNPLLVEDGVRGYLFDPHNVDDIARSIQRFSLLTNDQITRMGEQCRAFAKENLSLDACADEYERILT